MPSSVYASRDRTCSQRLPYVVVDFLNTSSETQVEPLAGNPEAMGYGTEQTQSSGDQSTRLHRSYISDPIPYISLINYTA